jgi:hypothetical protein
MMRIGVLAAAAAARVVEQRQAAAGLGVVDETVLDQMAVQRHLAERARLHVLGADADHPDAVAPDEVAGRQRRDLVDAGTGVGTDPGHPAAGRGHLDADLAGRLDQRRRQDRARLLAVEALVAFQQSLAHPHLHLLGRVFRKVSLVDGVAEQRLGGGEIDVPDRDALHAAGSSASFHATTSSRRMREASSWPRWPTSRSTTGDQRFTVAGESSASLA